MSAGSAEASERQQETAERRGGLTHPRTSGGRLNLANAKVDLLSAYWVHLLGAVDHARLGERGLAHLHPFLGEFRCIR